MIFFPVSRSVLLLQPKTEDSHRLKIHALDNDVDKNVLRLQIRHVYVKWG